MQALCVRQPFAELIARGVKDLEIRTWRTEYRGNLLIVASSTIDSFGREAMAKFGLRDRDCPTGRAICAVKLDAIMTVRNTTRVIGRRGDYAPVYARACCEPSPGDWAWHLSFPVRVQPFAVRGRLRLFDVPDAQIVRVDGAALHL
jgi:hypothetical protein